jgi:hypothetical protein
MRTRARPASLVALSLLREGLLRRKKEFQGSKVTP